jgi:hypothetical protein
VLGRQGRGCGDGYPEPGVFRKAGLIFLWGFCLFVAHPALLQLSEVKWRLNLGLAQSSERKMTVPNALLELTIESSAKVLFPLFFSLLSPNKH